MSDFSDPTPMEPPLPDLIPITITKTADKGMVEGGHPIFEGYTLRALIQSDNLPVVGERYTVFRVERNGVKMAGVFETSPVTAVGTYTVEADKPIPSLAFETNNSCYRIDFTP